ncbi:MAG TPA: rod shape-determining protein MreC [Planctomycetaceae bacterium]|nr:rod shape-determining protein MreC [Planctomycetaceae bacterium]
MIAVAALSAGAVGLFLASPDLTRAIRAAVRDATRPGQRVAAAAVRSGEDLLARLRRDDGGTERKRLHTQLDAWKLRARRLALETATVREQMGRLRETGPSPLTPVPSEPLVSAELIAASVLGAEHARQWRAGQFIDKGTLDGVPESALVLEATEPVLDQGATSGVEPGQPVYAGRCVVGRVAHAGRWMSTVQPVTHPEYRGFAQIVRRADESSVFGPRGILEGAGGPLCRLRIVDATASVEVGDEVYTGERDGTLPFPMYYGTIVSAELDAQTLEWDIRVQPAVRELAGHTVCVLRRSVNPLRLTAEPDGRDRR